jgi:chromosome partitioning protein
MILVVANPKGGVGKTLISTNFVAIAVGEGVESELVDTDIKGGSRGWMQIRNSENIQPFIPLKIGVDNPVAELLHEATKYDLLVVDIGANSHENIMKYASVADLIIVPTGPDQLELDMTVSLFSDFRAQDHKHMNGRFPAYAVLNQLPTSAASKEEQALREFLEEESIEVFQAGLKHRTSWRNSRRAGMAIHEMKGKDRDKKAALEMRAIFDETVALMNKKQPSTKVSKEKTAAAPLGVITVKEGALA